MWPGFPAARLSDCLGANGWLANVAHDLDKTPHAFMVEALALQTEQAERRRQLVETALAAEQDVQTRGLVHDADDAFAWLRSKLAGESPRRPRPRTSGKLA